MGRGCGRGRGGRLRRAVPVGALALVVAMVATSCLTDLGVPGGATGLTNHGVLVGATFGPPDASGTPTQHAFKRLPGGKVVDLPPLPGHAWSFAFAVNEQEVAVGTSSPTDSENYGGPVAGTRAVQWDAAGNVTDLGDLGGDESEARGINAAGAVVGTSYDAAHVRHAVVFHPGASPTVLDDLPGGHDPSVWAVNDLGQAVGSEWADPNQFGRAIRWDVATGAATPLASVGTNSTSAFGIAPDGAIVGMSRFGDPGTGPTDLAMWLPGSDVAIDLGNALGQTTMQGLVINRDHVIAGFAFGSGRPKAFRWDPVTRAFSDLGTLDPASSTLPLAINDAGTIVGTSGDRVVRFVVGTGPSAGP